MGSGQDWQNSLLPYFEDYFNICPDLPGHGKSLLATQTDMHQIIDLLIQKLSKQGLIRYTIIGYSMGGRLGFNLLNRYPQQVQALVGISTAPGLRTRTEQQKRQAADQVLMDRLDRIGLPDFLESWYQLPLFRNLAEYPELRQQLITTRLHNDPHQLRLALNSMGNGKAPLIWDHLSRMSKPVLLVTGADDAKYCQLNKVMSQQLPKARQAIIPHADHAVHLEKPLETARILKHFLSALN